MQFLDGLTLTNKRHLWSILKYRLHNRWRRA